MIKIDEIDKNRKNRLKSSKSTNFDKKINFTKKTQIYQIINILANFDKNILNFDDSRT
jgi:hypothetical protein